MSAYELEISEEHPLALELASLRASVARYQHEAHTISVKLQRHSLEASEALERSHALERENARLHEEIHTLRTNPDLTPHPAALQVPELSLALRRLSDKLTYTEDILLSRTNELVQVQNELAQALSGVATAQELASQVRAREEEGNARERDLERKARAAEEERRLADRALQEYADLVRSLEGRPSKTSGASTQSSASNVTPAASFSEDRAGLHRLLEEFNAEKERLSLEINRLQHENESFRATLESERTSALAERDRFAETALELDRYKADDNTAAKMVSRYMKFSQSTTDSLQEALERLRQRHNAATATLELRLDNAHRSLQSEHRQAEKLRSALDELSEDISREAFGRRREISLRLAFLTREEALAESLRRWIQKSRESLERSLTAEGPGNLEKFQETHHRIMEDAEALLESLNGQPASDEESTGSIARFILAQDSVASLTKELQQETEKRFEAQRRLAHLEHVAEALIDGTHHNPALSSTSRKAPPPARLTNSLKSESRESLSRSVTLVDIPIVDSATAITQNAAEEDLIGPLDISTTVSLGAATTSDTEQKAITLPKDSVLDPLVLDRGHSQNPVLSLLDSDSQANPPSSFLNTSGSNPVALDASAAEMPVTRDDEATTLDMLPDVNQHPIYQPTAVRASARQPIPTTVIVSELEAPSASEPTVYQLNSPPQIVVDAIPLLFANKDTIPEAEAEASTVQAEPADEQPQLPSAPVPDLRGTLLRELASVTSRYDDLQKAFHDCNIALKELRKDIGLLPLDSETIVRTAVDRLDDFSEDARVELEIRLSDEERIITGYKTLLTVPGAISDEVDESEMLREIRMFIDGSDPAVARSLSQFSRKLDDLQHDVASVKRYMHELAASSEEFTPSTPTRQAQSWSSWTAGILGSSRPVSPAPAPTFGTVMTSPRARQASFSSVHKSTSRPALGALFSSSAAERENPFSALGLRIPMPAHAAAPPSPSHGGLFAVGPHVPRTRVASAPIYTLGLARSSSFGLTVSPLDSPRSRPTPKVENNHGLGVENPLDSDIE
ncbi:hypothetical protein EIP86_004308 [Pleurotus ostreatoroseus]|nr:hypothetical protein EIP86_004308 [Pleurotus ostreatoroseus]